jgi:DNA-binding transcriptional ArsR family regulator
MSERVMPAAQNVEQEQDAVIRRIEQMRVHAPDAAGLMKALGNESRLMILCTLAEGERSVGELNAMIPLSQSALSQQLARLRGQGIVKTRRESQTIYYSLAEGPADRVIRLLHDIYCGIEK